jgi:hypothetical protein
VYSALREAESRRKLPDTDSFRFLSDQIKYRGHTLYGLNEIVGFW